MGAGLPIGRNWPTSFIWRIHRNEWDLLSKSLKIIDKGQIKSEWIYEGIDFPNLQLKNLKDFCPKSLFEAYTKSSNNNFELHMTNIV